MMMMMPILIHFLVGSRSKVDVIHTTSLFHRLAELVFDAI